MKKTIAFLLSGLLMLSGCASSSANVESSFPPVIKETPAPATAAPETEQPKAMTVSARYTSTNENFGKEYRPSVEFKEDGTFVFHENLLDGMGDYTGTYKYDGSYYDCSVSTISFSGYKGDDVKTFTFLQFDANTLQLLDDLCGSMARDVFVMEKSASPEGSSLLESSGGSIKPAQEVGDIKSTRTYESSSKMFSSPYLPTLVLNPDGTFVLTENLFEGMGHYSGTYEADDYVLTLHVDSTDFSGFAGDDVKEIRFEALSQDAFQLMTDLCGSVKFDTWYLRAD